MKRGVRVVTNVERGMRWTRSGRQTSGAGADGEVVWVLAPRRWGQVCEIDDLAGDGG